LGNWKPESIHIEERKKRRWTKKQEGSKEERTYRRGMRHQKYESKLISK
jgi:hypothetical protein